VSWEAYLSSQQVQVQPGPQMHLMHFNLETSAVLHQKTVIRGIKKIDHHNNVFGNQHVTDKTGIYI